ncbi:MAG TPA: hypothetical protein VLF39_03275 [Candidatus Saccharimonadales bacterium]|nr:hypothetical protein [Candidatus Saccharimonadales bacterium]
MPNPESIPSVRVFREVETLGDRWLSAAQKIIGQTGIEHVELRHKPRATIVGPGEVRSFHSRYGLRLIDDDAENLADYLDDCLPASVDKDIGAPTWPWSLHELCHRGETETSLTIATRNPAVKAERLATQSLINRYYDIPGTPQTTWEENDYITQVHIAKFKGQSQRHNLKQFADQLIQAAVIPELIGFRHAEIEDVYGYKPQ